MRHQFYFPQLGEYTMNFTIYVEFKVHVVTDSLYVIIQLTKLRQIFLIWSCLGILNKVYVYAVNVNFYGDEQRL